MRTAGLFTFCLGLASPALAQWTLTTITTMDVKAMVRKDGYLFAAANNSVKRSADNGDTWTSFNSGISSANGIFEMVVQGDAIIASANNGVYRSTDNGENWTQVVTNGSYYRSLAVHGSNIFTGYDYGVLRSTDNGATWTNTSGGMPLYPDNSTVYTLESDGTDLYAGTWDAGAFKSINNTSWSSVNSGLPDLGIKNIMAYGEDLILSTSWDGLYISSDNAGSWSYLGSLPGVQEMIVHGSTLIAATGAGIHTSSNGGANWTLNNAGLTDNDMYSVLVSEPYLFACGWGVWRIPLSQLAVGITEQADNPATLHPCFPNPVTDAVTIRFALERSAQVTIELQDVMGRAVQALYRGLAAPGEQRFNFSTEQLANGAYICALRVDGRVMTQELIVAR